MRSRFVPERQTTSLQEPDPVTPNRLQSRTMPPSLSQGDKMRGHLPNFVPERQTTSLKEPDPVTPNHLQSRTIPPSLSQEDKMRGHFVPRRQNEEAILSQGDKMRRPFCPKATKYEAILSQGDKMRANFVPERQNEEPISPDTGNRMPPGPQPEQPNLTILPAEGTISLFDDLGRLRVTLSCPQVVRTQVSSSTRPLGKGKSGGSRSPP